MRDSKSFYGTLRVTDIVTPHFFRERFALATFREGAILVDVRTGSYSRLNASAATVCAELERSADVEAAIAGVAGALMLSPTSAADQLRSVSVALGSAGVRKELPSPFRYRPSEREGYDLWHADRMVLHVDEAGQTLTLTSRATDLRLPLFDYVSAVAPKVLFLQGLTVLHASGCVQGGSLMGICGMSGAGKTTTATLLAKHGARLVSEDLLILRANSSAPEIFISGEARVNGWALRAALELVERNGSPLDTALLAEAASGPTIPLQSIWFLDARRRGESFSARRLDQCEAVVELMANSFLGAANPASWRRHLAESSAISAAVGSYEIDLPQGLDRLEQALGRYTSNSTS